MIDETHLKLVFGDILVICGSIKQNEINTVFPTMKLYTSHIRYLYWKSTLATKYQQFKKILIIDIFQIHKAEVNEITL